MKLFIYSFLLIHIFSLNLRHQLNLQNEYYSETYDYVVDPIYYSCSPMYYTYYTSPIYYYYQTDSYTVPTTYIFYRQNGNQTQNSTKAIPLRKKSIDELKEELENLKKTIWGDPNYKTDELRKNGKVYDAKWLLAQMKITRVVELEDFLSLKQKTQNESTSETIPNRIEPKQNSTVEVNKRVEPIQEQSNQTNTQNETELNITNRVTQKNSSSVTNPIPRFLQIQDFTNETEEMPKGISQNETTKKDVTLNRIDGKLTLSKEESQIQNESSSLNETLNRKDVPLAQNKTIQMDTGMNKDSSETTSKEQKKEEKEEVSETSLEGEKSSSESKGEQPNQQII